ncbi:TlpA family protein disulfide reductase [Cumulibacter soli]|uniref:TlpA family protein disulfide reductase n=1 Tax=Cumulibacter soli TaxID=2546344 RepID=UPI001068C812|nr:TlpA disulfide reductase family protein [Cumulibacter soli]
MRLVRILTAFLVSALALAGCSASTDAPEGGSEFRFVEGTPHGEVIPVDERQDAPNISGELLDGEPFELDDYADTIVVMNFWATWCPPCRVEAPDLQAVYETYQPQGVQLIGVLVRDSKGQGETYSKQEGLTYPSLFDPSTKIGLQLNNYPLAAIPSTVVFDAEGRVAAAYTAPVNLDDLTSTIEKLLAE